MELGVGAMVVGSAVELAPSVEPQTAEVTEPCSSSLPSVAVPRRSRLQARMRARHTLRPDLHVGRSHAALGGRGTRNLRTELSDRRPLNFGCAAWSRRFDWEP